MRVNVDSFISFYITNFFNDKKAQLGYVWVTLKHIRDRVKWQVTYTTTKSKKLMHRLPSVF